MRCTLIQSNSTRSLLAALLSVAAVGLLVGCHPIEPSINTRTPQPGEPGTGYLQAPPAPIAQPITQQGPIYVEPGQAVTGAPGFVLPTQPMTIPQPSPPADWWDVLPQGGGAISPDFGLPRAPVVSSPVPNPLIVPAANNELAWDQLADVVTNYFPIKREQQVQVVGGMVTEGFIETPYQVGATLIEPQRNDSVGSFNRWQSTLQTIRRKAVVNVQPTGGGYAVQVTVLKQLEDLAQPDQALSGATVVRNDGALPTRRRSQVNLVSASESWIDLGRDEPLEQEMLRRIRDRLAAPLPPSASQPVW